MAGFAEYEEFDATGLAGLIEKREVSPDELLDAALVRAEALNPKLNALVNLRVETARKHISEGLPEGPFHGVPFLLKDLGAEAVDFPSHNGSLLFADTEYSYDSELFARLKQTGLVTFGRTTSPEGGIGAVTEAQVYGGPTRNPWNLDHTSGGSSGGAGAAVAAGIVPAAHGSDGGGSVRIPASSCGLFGFKPTRARLPDGPASGEGWGGMAIEGFLTRSVRDTAALLDAVAGPDLGAPYWAPPMEGTFSEAMGKPPQRLRVAFQTTSFTGASLHPECRAAVEDAARLMLELGHEVEEITLDIDIYSLMCAWTNIVASGTALSVRERLQSRGRALERNEIEGVTRGALALAENISGADYLDALNDVHAFGRQMARLFVPFDVLITPTLAEPPAKVGRFKPVNEDFLDYRLGPEGILPYSPFTAAFNASGQPAVSIPLHWTADNLPVGVHFAAAFGQDELLMTLSAQVEKARPWFARRPPEANRFKGSQ
jgi:amidase/6-aminohexanoate-cyclic-dimer hydrolase